MIKVVGTIFIKDDKILIDKPRKRLTYQMIGGGVEDGEDVLYAAIREIKEELGPKAIFDENLIEPVMDFDEIATSTKDLKIHVYLFIYTGELTGEFTLSEEIEDILWYDTSMTEIPLSNTLNNEVIPYCIKNKLIK